MNRSAVILLVAASGCFYTDRINQRPSVAIHWDPVQLYRGAALVASAIPDDPDGDSVAFQWRTYACNQNADGLICDDVLSDSGIDNTYPTHVPTAFKDMDKAGLVVNAVKVTLEARDSYGATAKPIQILEAPVDDVAPVLELHAAPPRHAYVVYQPVPVYAKIGDADDVMVPADDSKIMVGSWLAEGPSTANNFTLPDATISDPDPNDPTHFQLTNTFTPTVVGEWKIHLTATDPAGNAGQMSPLAIYVETDSPPCLAQWDPTATSLPNTTIPITDPTLFQVLVVSDDLDPYPSVPNDPVLGTTEFHWSMVPPGGTRQALTTVTGSGVALDPNSYTPGDIVELRVEIQDRNHTPVNCPDGDLTCSVISDQSCLQRLTWRAEVR